MTKKTLEPVAIYDPYRPRAFETEKQREDRRDLERRDSELAKLQARRDARHDGREMSLRLKRLS